MQLKQKRTFLPYLRGIPPEALRLGSLYINPLEPNDGLSSKRFKYRSDIKDQDEYEKQAKEWTWPEELDRPFSIDFETSQASSLGLSFSEWASVKGERSKATLVTIRGESGRRLKIENPEPFLEQVMKQDGVEKWVRTHASLKHQGLYKRHRWNAPEIWMVTGVQYVTGGEIHFEGSSSSKSSAQAGGDLGLAVGAPPGMLKVNGEASREKSNGAKNDFGHDDERVWAAQFMPVTIKFGPDEDTELTAQEGQMRPKTILTTRLEDVPDLGARGIRAAIREDVQPSSPPPKLIGRVTAPIHQPELHPNERVTKDPEGITIDDAPYVASVQNTDWDIYDAGLKWLAEVESRRNSVRGDN